MKVSKLVDDISISIDLEKVDIYRTCFVVFSSKEKHIEIVIDCIERIIQEKENFAVKRLDESLKSEDSQYKELTELLKSCTFAVVILDGLRPNVLFEYGILKGLGKPCIVLLEEEAEVDLISYFLDNEKIEIDNPKIDVDKHVSDIKDRFYRRYGKNRPKEIRTKIQKEFSRLKEEIEEEFVHMLIPNKELVEKELKGQLELISNLTKKNANQLNQKDEVEFRTALKKVNEIIMKYKIKPSEYYYYILATIFAKFEKYEEAIEIIDSVIENKKEYIRLILLKANLLLDMKKFDEAIKTIDIALTIQPKMEAVWHIKGLILEQMDKNDEAMLCYKKGVELEEKCSGLHFSYGILFYEIEKYEDALNQFESALKLKPVNDAYLLWKGRTLNKLGRKDEAKAIIEESICFNNNNPNAWFALGQLTSNIEEGINHFDKALSLDPKHAGALCSKAADLSNLGKHEDALEIFNDIGKMCIESEKCPILQLNIAKTLCKSGQFDEAKKYVDNVLISNDKDTEAIILKATIVSDLGDQARALEYLNGVLNVNEKDFEALGVKGMVLLKMDKIEESLEYYKKSLEINPENAAVLYNQSCAFARLERIDECISSLKKAIRLDPSNAELIETDSDFDGIRDNEKFKKELSDMK